MLLDQHSANHFPFGPRGSTVSGKQSSNACFSARIFVTNVTLAVCLLSGSLLALQPLWVDRNKSDVGGTTNPNRGNRGRLKIGCVVGDLMQETRQVFQAFGVHAIHELLASIRWHIRQAICRKVDEVVCRLRPPLQSALYFSLATLE